MKVDQLDWNLTPVNPDPDFSPENNKRVIEDVIQKGEIMAKRKQKEAEDGIRERNDAIASYLKDTVEGKTKSNVEKYFGSQELARLRGKEILNKLKYSDLGTKMKSKLLEIKNKYKCG